METLILKYWTQIVALVAGGLRPRAADQWACGVADADWPPFYQAVA